MHERERRIAANEAVARQVNEELAPFQPRDVLDLVCECGRPDCRATISVSRGEYEGVRSDSTHFLTKAGHEILDVETTVDASGAYVVVEKDAPEAREFAEQHDPRS